MIKKSLAVLPSFLVLVLLASCNLPVPATATFPVYSSTEPVPTGSPAAETALPAESSAAPAGTQPANPPPVVSDADRYAVLLVDEDDVLNIRSGPGTGYSVIGWFAADEDNVRPAGQTEVVDAALWLQIENPSGGQGWVNAGFLTEYVPAEQFCADPRVTALLDELTLAVNNEDGDLLESLVSPRHGFELYYYRYGPSANYTPAEASWVFKSNFDVEWGAGASGIDDVGAFREYPLPSLLEVLNDEDLELRCNDADSAAMYVEPWPVEYQNANFYALYKPPTPDVDLDWAVWLAGVEYVNGEPYLFTLIRFIWEP